METVDTLISARWVIPIEPAARVLERHAVAVRQGRIIAVVPADTAHDRFRAADVIERPQHVLLPGFVNALALTVPALPARSGPEAVGSRNTTAAEDPEFAATHATLAIARLVRSGTTCFGTTGRHPDVVARTAASLQVRTVIGLPVSERPTAWATITDEYFDRALALHDDYRDDPLVSTAFAPVAGDALTDQTLERLRRNADEIELPVLASLSTDSPGGLPVTRLARLGLLSPQLVACSPLSVSGQDLDVLAEAGAQALLAPGPLADCAAAAVAWLRLRERRINTGFGSGHAGHGDVLRYLQTLVLLATETSPATCMPEDFLAALTLGGARTLGLADAIGSIVPGKWADLCCIDLSDLRTQPVCDPPAQLLGAAASDQVSDVWVAGRPLLGSGTLTRIDPAATLERIRYWSS